MMIQKSLRFILSGIAAFLFLNFGSFFYYAIPVHISSKTGATDYVWESHARYSKMTEGFGYGRMNNEGFNNFEDFQGQPINALIMGSSHMEGTNLPQKLIMSELLNKRLCASKDDSFKQSKSFYNIGISGHNFPHIINNFESALRHYVPTEYAIIEIGSLAFDIHSLELGIDSKLEKIPSYTSKVMFFLQKIPYLRLIYQQYKQGSRKDTEGQAQGKNPATDYEKYKAAVNRAMQKLSELGKEHAIHTIIFYHPQMIIHNDGSLSDTTDLSCYQIFENACRDNNIHFISMYDTFAHNYRTNHILPHGFSNTAVGTGHLNRYGHGMIADKLSTYIYQAEKDGVM